MVLNITKEVARMERLSVSALCERYHEVFGEDTKARNKQWLIKRIAWKLQANEEGDISERARKLAMEIAQSSDIRTSAPKIRTRPVETTFETATTIIIPPADNGSPEYDREVRRRRQGSGIEIHPVFPIRIYNQNQPDLNNYYPFGHNHHYNLPFHFNNHNETLGAQIGIGLNITW